MTKKRKKTKKKVGKIVQLFRLHEKQTLSFTFLKKCPIQLIMKGKRIPMPLLPYIKHIFKNSFIQNILLLLC